MLMGALRSNGVRVPRERVRESLRRIDTWGIATRWAEIIPRRRYHVAGPNSLWHIDGNHKLIRWKFVIHGVLMGIQEWLRICIVAATMKLELYCLIF
jgi:hypothetical protein